MSTAKRTEQYCGNRGTADIDCPELRTWHIESKGTKTGLLEASKLRNWIKQVETDCPPDKKWVIINTPNNRDKIAILSLDTWIRLADSVISTMKFSNIDYHSVIGDSLSPNDLIWNYNQSKYLDALIWCNTKKAYLSSTMETTLVLVYCPVWSDAGIPEKTLVMVKADEWLDRAKKALSLP